MIGAIGSILTSEVGKRVFKVVSKKLTEKLGVAVSDKMAPSVASEVLGDLVDKNGDVSSLSDEAIEAHAGEWIAYNTARVEAEARKIVAEVQAISEINQTMRAEIGQTGWKSWWRPALGCSFVFWYNVTFLIISSVVVQAFWDDEVKPADVLSDNQSLIMWLLLTGGAGVGIYIHNRTQEKKAGIPAKNALDRIIDRFAQ